MDSSFVPMTPLTDDTVPTEDPQPVPTEDPHQIDDRPVALRKESRTSTTKHQISHFVSHDLLSPQYLFSFCPLLLNHRQCHLVSYMMNDCYNWEMQAM